MRVKEDSKTGKFTDLGPNQLFKLTEKTPEFFFVHIEDKKKTEGGKEGQ